MREHRATGFTGLTPPRPSLLISVQPADGEIASLRLAGVRVTGRLDLEHATVPYAVRF